MKDPRIEGSFIQSESSKYIHLTLPYLSGNGVDLGSGGWPVVPWAIQVEQPAEAFLHYTNGRTIPSGTEWLGDILDLPFKDGVLDFCYSSHLIEDFCRDDTDDYPVTWPKLFREWSRVLKPGGFLVILVPEVIRWNEAIKHGQTPNCSHFAPEPNVGDLTATFTLVGLEVIEDRLTNLDDEDYSIIGVGRKTL